MRGTLFRLDVRPELPESLKRLEELANNLWYSWDRPSRTLFARLDPELWQRIGHSPKAFLRNIDQQRLRAAADDPMYLSALQRVMSGYDAYHGAALGTNHVPHMPAGEQIAYFPGCAGESHAEEYNHSALAAADAVIIPMQCEYYALEGLSGLVSTIEQVRESVNPRLSIEGILRTMFDPRNNLANDVSAQLIEHFGDKVFRTIIPRNVRLAEAPSFGVPVMFHDKESRGALAYLALAGELIRREDETAPPAD